MKLLYLIRKKVDLMYQILFTRPIEFFLTFRKKDPLEKIFTKLLYCKNKKVHFDIYYTIHQRAMNDLVNLLCELKIAADWKYYYDSGDRELEHFSKENVYCDIFSNRIMIDLEETTTFCGSQKVFSVTICDSERSFLETFIESRESLKETKKRPFSFHSNEAREDAIFYDMLDCFHDICKKQKQCP